MLNHNSHALGTSGLRRHVCAILPGQTKLVVKQTALPASAKQDTTEKCVTLCCKDIRPYDVVAGDGFVNIVQHFVNLGAKYGRFNVKDVLPHPTTVSRNVVKTAQAMKGSVAEEIKPIIEAYGCAITTDIWTEDYHKTSYISSTIHYTNNDFGLVSRVLFAAPFENGTPKTQDNIRNLLFQRLAAFGIDASLLASRVVFVTDRGANIVAALRAYTRLNCNAHILNVVLSSAFAPAVLDKTPALSELLSTAKKLVKYFKHSGLQNSLDTSLKQSIETRWNSNYEMLESILTQYDAVSQLLVANNQYERLAPINADTLKTVVKFLQKFKEATNLLEGNNDITASLALPWSIKLIEHCQEHTTSPLLSEVAKVCVSRLLELMGTSTYAPNKSLHMLFRIATFLKPKLRLLRMLGPDARDDVVRSMY